MYNGLSADYILDKMQMYEIKPLISASYLRNKDSWEQARLIAFIVAQANSSKKLKVSDIMSFGWDEKQKKPTVSNEDVERLRKKTELIQKKLYGS